MTDIEQTEVWRNKFVELYPLAKHVPYSDAHGFMDSVTDNVWCGFKLAMRSQPVIELPKPNCHCFDDDNGVDVWSYMPDTVFNAITTAGYKYNVTGE